jgi:hypothetical protein
MAIPWTATAMIMDDAMSSRPPVNVFPASATPDIKAINPAIIHVFPTFSVFGPHRVHQGNVGSSGWPVAFGHVVLELDRANIIA